MLTGGDEIDIEGCLLDKLSQYNLTNGLPALRKFLLDIQQREHSPPQQAMLDSKQSNFDLTVTCGITGALYCCVECLMDEEDVILMEDVSYGTFITNLSRLGKNIHGVSFDESGMLPDSLEDILKTWNKQHPGKRMPKLLYTVSLASNPLGHNWSLSRMVEIYLICRKYDLLIMDDGAYHFLQFGERARSFQSLDVDGRVIRFDSFSKIIGAGYRLGWASGPACIIERINTQHKMTCVYSSILAQIVVYSMLKHWGTCGLETRIKTVVTFYKKQAEYVSNACEKYLSGLASWTVPKGGMYLWVSLRGCCSSEDIIKELKDKHDVRMSSGHIFQTDRSVGSNSFRLCFSRASQDEIDHSLKCLADLLATQIFHW